MTSTMEGKVNSLFTHPHCARHLQAKKLSAFLFILSMFFQSCDFSVHCQLKNLTNFNLAPPSFSLLGYWNYSFSPFSHIITVSPRTLPTEASSVFPTAAVCMWTAQPQSPCVKGFQAKTSGRQSLRRAHCEESGSKLFKDGLFLCFCFEAGDEQCAPQPTPYLCHLHQIRKASSLSDLGTDSPEQQAK